MKKKFLVLTLCFTLIFSSFNYKKSYADGGIISLPLVATVATLGVGVGLTLNSVDDIYNLAYVFKDYIDNHNDLTMSSVLLAFNSSVFLNSNNLVSVGSDFLDIVKDFFDSKFNKVADSFIDVVGFMDRLPYYGVYSYDLLSNYYNLSPKVVIPNDYLDFQYLDYTFDYVSSTGRTNFYHLYKDGQMLNYNSIGLVRGSTYATYFATVGSSAKMFFGTPDSSVSFYYEPNKIVLDSFNYEHSQLDNICQDLNVPSNLSDLVGSSSSDVINGNYQGGLVGNGSLSLPSVSNPSIDIDTSVDSFVGGVVDSPGVDSPSVPNDGIWATIKDFVIGLVVPSDTYWSDTWGGLYNNFTNSFPMVDMDGFNDLVTGEKKFPNIDINIMGVTGRVVNGDIINSIVDWLRPIIAGFMMLCLMLFNYRKIYKLVRNSEPFGGIAPGTSDFKTGISEYTHVGLVNDGFKRSEEEEFARSRYYEEMYFKNGGKV